MAVASVRTDMVLPAQARLQADMPIGQQGPSSRSTSCSWPTLPCRSLSATSRPSRCRLHLVPLKVYSLAGILERALSELKLILDVQRKLRPNLNLDGIRPTIDAVSHGEYDCVVALSIIMLLWTGRRSARRRQIVPSPNDPNKVLLGSQ